MCKKLTGRLYALPHSRKFELHQEDGRIVCGRIDPVVTFEQIQQFNGKRESCLCVTYEGIEGENILDSIQAMSALEWFFRRPSLAAS